MTFRVSHIDTSCCKPLQLERLLILDDIGIKKSCAAEPSEYSRLLLHDLFSTRSDNKKIADHVFSVASLPRRLPSFLVHHALERESISAGHVVELGSNCASILDGFFFCSVCTKTSSTSILLFADAFSSYRAKSADEVWKDGAAAILFSDVGQFLSIISYVTGTDTCFVKNSSFSEGDDGYILSLSQTSEFLSDDLINEMTVAEAALVAAKLEWSDLNGYVTINRSANRAKLLNNILRKHRVRLYESRESFGHRGGTDLINNLSMAILNTKQDRKIFLLSAGGLGYTWSAIILSLI